MAQSLRSDCKRLPDRLRPGCLPGMVGQVQSGFARLSIEMPEWFRAGMALVPSEADSNNRWIASAQLGGLAEDALGFCDSEVPNSVEDPIDRHPEFALPADTRPLEAFEDGFETCCVVLAPHVDDADRDVDFGVDDALGGERFDHAPGDEFVVIGADQLARDGLEGIDESGKVSELIECFRLLQ